MMLISEIIVNSKIRLLDEIKGNPISGMIYEFHDNVSTDSEHFTKPIYAVYNPEQISKSIEFLEKHSLVVEQLFQPHSQMFHVLNDLIDYFHS